LVYQQCILSSKTAFCRKIPS